MSRNLMPVFFLLVFVCLPTISFASGVEWDVVQTLNTEAPPIDVAVSADGKYSFILTDGGRVVILANDGSRKETIQVPDTVETIAASPGGEALFLLDRAKKTVQVITLDFVSDIDISGSPFKGKENALVTLVVFSDFQCPYCSRVLPLLDLMLKRYPDDVKIVFKNFPLMSIHRFARSSAQAALAADKQGKFWEFHDALFEGQSDLSEEKIVDIADLLKLDVKQFERDRASDEVKQQVDKDIKDGNMAGIKGTPSVFINGRLVRSYNPEIMFGLIEKVLKKTKK